MFGTLTDPFADKLLVLGSLGALAAAGRVPWWIVVIIGARELWVTVLRAHAKRHGVVVGAGPLGKIKMVVQVFTVLALMAFDITGARSQLRCSRWPRSRSRPASRSRCVRGARPAPVAAPGDLAAPACGHFRAHGRGSPNAENRAACAYHRRGFTRRPILPARIGTSHCPRMARTESRSTGRLSKVWPAVAASVAEARTAVSAFAQAAGATADALAAVSLAVSEAVTNAVLHAYLDRDDARHRRGARGAARPSTVVVVVADEGRGMLPRTDSPGLGLGLPLIAQMTQSLEVHDRDGGGTEIRMAFALDATA